MSIDRYDLFAAAAIAGLAAKGANPNTRIEDAWEIADDMIRWGGDREPQGPHDSLGTSPFADINIAELHVDLAEALEQFKLVIIRHRAGQFQEASKHDICQVLDALRAFVDTCP